MRELGAGEVSARGWGGTSGSEEVELAAAQVVVNLGGRDVATYHHLPPPPGIEGQLDGMTE